MFSRVLWISIPIVPRPSRSSPSGKTSGPMHGMECRVRGEILLQTAAPVDLVSVLGFVDVLLSLMNPLVGMLRTAGVPRAAQTGTQRKTLFTDVVGVHDANEDQDTVRPSEPRFANSDLWRRIFGQREVDLLMMLMCLFLSDHCHKQQPAETSNGLSPSDGRSPLPIACDMGKLIWGLLKFCKFCALNSRPNSSLECAV